MKKLLAAATALSGFLALAGAASAADPGVVDPGYDWSGFYLGVNAGVAFGETNGSQSLDPVQNNANASAIAIINNTNNDSYSSTDFTGGLTLGYNQQMDSLVLGIEGDVNFMDLSGSKNSTFTAGATGRGEDSTSADFLATARLRLGYAMDRSLFYVTGGAAFTDAKASQTLDWTFADGCPAVPPAGFQRCHDGDKSFGVGWTVGGGMEFAFTGNWTMKAEYLYTDFGSAKFQTTNAGTVVNQAINHKDSLDVHVVRVGINYKF